MSEVCSLYSSTVDKYLLATDLSTELCFTVTGARDMSELDKVLQDRRKLTEGQSSKVSSPAPKPPPPRKPQLQPKINPKVANKIKESLTNKPTLPTKPKLHPPKQSVSKSRSGSEVDSSSSPGVTALANLLQANQTKTEVNGTAPNSSSLPRHSKPSRLEKTMSVELQKPRSASDGVDRPFSVSLESSGEFFNDSPRQRSSPVVSPKCSPLFQKKRASSMSPSKSVDTPLATKTQSASRDSSSSREHSAELDADRYERSTSLPRDTRLSPLPPGEGSSQSRLEGNLVVQSEKLKASSASDIRKLGVNTNKKKVPPPLPKKPPILGDKPQLPRKPGASKPSPLRKPLTKDPHVDKDVLVSEKSVPETKSLSTSALPSPKHAEDTTSESTADTVTHSTSSKVSPPGTRKVPPRPPPPYKKTSSPTPPAPSKKPSSPEAPVSTLTAAPPKAKTAEARRTPPTPPPPYRKTPSPPTPKSPQLPKLSDKWPPQQQGSSPPVNGGDSPIQQQTGEDSTSPPATGVKALSEKFSTGGPTIRVTLPSVTEIDSSRLKQKRIVAKENTDSGIGPDAPDDISLARGTSVESLPEEVTSPLSPTKEAPEEEWDEKRVSVLHDCVRSC